MLRLFLICLILFLGMSESFPSSLRDDYSSSVSSVDGEFTVEKDVRDKAHPAQALPPWDIIYSSIRSYTILPNDTLKKIARRHQTTIDVIQTLNRLKGSRIYAGQKLFLPGVVFNLEINKTLNRLYLKAGDLLVKEYPVSTGKSSTQTPLGVFIIQSRYPFPVWFHQGKVVPGGAPDNYLGSRWLGFDKPQYGIHGTIFPEQIGQSVSKGCVRMKNEDVEELYEIIPIGTTVVISAF